MSKPWGDEDILRLHRMLRDRSSLAEISAALGRTVKAIETRAYRMGWSLWAGSPNCGGGEAAVIPEAKVRVRGIDWSDQQTAYLLDAWPKGVSTPTILKHLNGMPGVKATTGSVLSKASRLNLQRPDSVFTNEAREPKAAVIRALPLAPILTRDMAPSMVRRLESGLFDGLVDCDADTVVEWAERNRIVQHAAEDRGMWLARVNEARRRYGLPGYRVAWGRAAMATGVGAAA